MGETSAGNEIRIWCFVTDSKQSLTLQEHDKTTNLKVYLPYSPLGINKKLKLKNGFHVQLQQSQSAKNTYLLKLQKDIQNKEFIHLECKVLDFDKCHATVTKCKVRGKETIQIIAEKVSTKSIHCNGALSLESNQDIDVQSSVICPLLSLKSSDGDVYLSTTEASISTSSLSVIAGTLLVAGSISYFKLIRSNNANKKENCESRLLIRIRGDLHISRDGRIGTNEKTDRFSNNLVEKLILDVKGDITNFGKISSSKMLSIRARTICTCQESKKDTTQRYYEIREKHICGGTDQTDYCPGTTDLYNAVSSGNVLDTAILLKSGKDPNMCSRSKTVTPLRQVEKDLKKCFTTLDLTSNEQRRNMKKVDGVASLTRAWINRYGYFVAPRIHCQLTGDLYNLSQFSGLDVTLYIKGNIRIEKGSKCTLGNLSGQCNGTFNIEGDAEIRKIKFFDANSFVVAKEAILVLENGGHINVNDTFENNHIVWNCGGNLDITTGIFQQKQECKLYSKSVLLIAIKKDSNIVEGEISAFSVSLRIDAQVVENCHIKSESNITLEIQENHVVNHTNHFCHKGSMKMLNGSFVVQRSNYVGNWENEDVRLDGMVTSRGIRAISSSIMMTSNSTTTILPDKNQEGPTNNPNITFEVGCLRTAKSSYVYFSPEVQIQNIRIHCQKMWRHYGTFKIITTSTIENVVEMYVWKFENHGYFSGFDILSIDVNAVMSSWQTLTSRREMRLTGIGEMYNQSGAILRCTNGNLNVHKIGKMHNAQGARIEGITICITTRQEENVQSLSYFDMRNAGIIFATGDIYVSSGNICNRGIIHSETSRIELVFEKSFSKATKLEGQVVAPMEIVIDIFHSPCFHFKCVGGKDCVEDIFHVPKYGLFLKCRNGKSILKRKIMGQSLLAITSPLGCSILKDIVIQKVFIKFPACLTKETNCSEDWNNDVNSLAEKDTVHEENEHCGVMDDVNELFDHGTDSSFRQNKPVYTFLNILDNKKLFAQDLVLKADIKSLQTRVHTFANSMVSIESDVFANNDLIFDGFLNLSNAGKIEANSISLTTNTKCTITVNEQNTDTKTFRMIADQDISLAGKITAGKGEVFQSRIETRHGNIALSGQIDLNDVLVLNSGEEKKITFEGHLDVVGPILIGKAKDIIANLHSFLQCEAFIFKTLSQKASVILNGRTFIKGPMYLQNVLNVTTTGILTTEGISASSTNMYLAQSSVTSIKSSRKLAKLGDHDIIHCCLNSLHTDTSSSFRLVYDKMKRTHAKLEMNIWIHRGLLEIIYAFPLSSELYIQIQKFTNKGRFKNIDCCYIECIENFDNFRTFAVKKVFTIVGSGKVHNHPGSLLQCKSGEILINDIFELRNDRDAKITCCSLSIDAQMTLENAGTISCKNEINIKVLSVDNEGVIESETSRIAIYWLNDTLQKSCIAGRIKSSKEIQFIANESNAFYFNCTGGKSDSVEEFMIPSYGLKIVCRNGSVYLNSPINNDLKSSLIYICSLNRCEITESVMVHTFNLEGKSEESESYRKTCSLHINKRANQTQGDFTLAVVSGGKLSISTLVAKMDNKTSKYVMETKQSGSVICYKSIHTNSDLYLTGLLYLDSSCSVYAPRLNFSCSSKCIIESLCDIHSNDDAKRCTKIYAKNLIDIAGELSECDGNIIIIRSEQEDINITGNTTCSDLSIVVQNKKICLNGVSSIDGVMEITGAKEIEFLKGSIIKCSALSCVQNEIIENKTEKFTVHGALEVHGSMVCIADSFILNDGAFLSVHSTNEIDQMYVNSETAEMFGNFECNMKGNCIFDCRTSILMENGATCVLAANECIFAAKKNLEMKDKGRIFVERGRLLLINEIDGTVEEIHGKINIRGTISGAYDGSNASCDSYMLIEGRNIDLQNLDEFDIATIDIQAAFTLLIDGNTHFRNGVSIEINAMTFDMKGEISKYTNFHLEVSNMLLLGKINNINEIIIKADLAAVNSGQISGVKTGIVAPIYLSCPQGFDGCQVTSVAELGNIHQKELIVEGLLCILVGSYLQGTKIKIKSVLQFEFSTKASTIPEPTDLDRWKTVVDSSLSKISSQLENQSAVNKLVEQAMRIPEVICKLGVASHLCSDIVGMTENICKQGLDAFKVDDLVTSLNKAHSEYSRISPLSLKINLNVRAKFKKIREPIQRAAKNLIKKLFGSDSFSSTGEFLSKGNEDVEEGIEVVSFIYEGENTDKKTKGMYFALSLELEGKLGSWQNGGYLETCGDIVISSGIIKQRSGKGRLLKAITGSIKLNATDVSIHNSNSANLQVSAKRNANLERIEVSKNTEIEAVNVNVNEIKTNALHVHAADQANIKRCDVEKNIQVHAKTSVISDSKAEYVKILADESTNIKELEVKETLHVEAHNVDMSEIKAVNMEIIAEENLGIKRLAVSKTIQVKAKNVHLSESKAEHIGVVAQENSTIKGLEVSNTIQVNAKHVDLSDSKAENVGVVAQENSKMKGLEVSKTIQVNAKHVDLSDSKAENVGVVAQENSKMKGLEVSNTIQVNSKHVDLSDSKAENVGIVSQENSTIKGLEVSNTIQVNAKHVDLSDSTAVNVGVVAQENSTIKGLEVSNTIQVNAKHVDLSDSTAENVGVVAQENSTIKGLEVGNTIQVNSKHVDLSDSKAEHVGIVSQENSTIKGLEVSNTLQVNAKHVDLSHSKAENVGVVAQENSTIKGLEVSNTIQVNAKHVDLSDSKAENVGVVAQENSTIKGLEVGNTIQVNSKHVDLSDSKAENVGVVAQENSTIKGLEVGNTIQVNAKHVDLSDSKAENVGVVAQENSTIKGLEVGNTIQVNSKHVDLSDSKAEHVGIVSQENSTIKGLEVSNTLQVNAKHVDLSHSKAENVGVVAQENSTIKGLEVSNTIQVNAKHVDLSDSKAENVGVVAQENSTIKGLEVGNTIQVNSKHVDLSDSKAENVGVVAQENSTIKGLEVGNTIQVNAKHVDLSDSKAENVGVVAQENSTIKGLEVGNTIQVNSKHVDLSDSKAEHVGIVSQENSTIKGLEVSNTLQVNAKHVDLSHSKAENVGVVAQENSTIKGLEVGNTIQVNSKHVDLSDSKAEHVGIVSQENSTIKGLEVSNTLQVNAKHVDLSHSKAENVGVVAQENSTIKGLEVSNTIQVNAKHVDLSDSKAENVGVVAQENSTIKGLEVGNTIQVNSKHVDLSDSKAENVGVVAQENSTIKGLEVGNTIQVNAKHVDLSDSKAENVGVVAQENSTIKGLEVGNTIQVNSKHVDLSDSKAEHVGIVAQENSDITGLEIYNTILVKAKNVDLSDIKAENVGINASENADISRVKVTNLLEVDANTADLSDAEADEINISTTQNINIGNIKANGLNAFSKEGDIALNSKVDAQNAILQAEQGNVSLLGTSKKANHVFESLTIHTKHIEKIENLLENEDVYSDLKISDHLGLFVEDQNVILARSHSLQYSLTLHAASIKLEGSIDATDDLQMRATKGNFEVGRQVNIKCKGNVLLKAKQDLTQSFGSSISSGKNLSLEAEDGSVDIIGSTAHAEESVYIKAKEDINIMSVENKEAPSTRSSVTSGYGDEKTPAIMLESGRDININASDVKSRGRNIFKAENNINITTNRYETVKTQNKTSWFGLSTETTKTTTTNIESSNIDGKSNCFIAKGDFKSTAGKLESEMGTYIHADGKVSMLDEITTENVETSSRFLGFFNSSKKETLSEKSIGTVLKDTSEDAQSSITSKNSNIEWVGSSIKTKGSVKETAKRGSVTHSRRILQQNEKEQKIGFYACKSSNPNEKGFGLKAGFEAYWADRNRQSTSNDTVEIKGNSIVTSNNFSASSDFHVEEDMTIDARNVTFKGTALKSDSSEVQLGFGMSQTAATLNYSQCKETSTINKAQSLYTGGKLHMINVDNATFDNANIDVGSLEGNINNMNVISRADSETKNRLGLSLEYDVVTETPGISVSYDDKTSERVNTNTTIHVRSSSQGLSVGKLTMKGAQMEFDGNVHNFANTIVNEDVHEKLNELKFGVSICKPKSAEHIKKSVQLGIHHSSGRVMNCISSKNGTVDSAISQKVNTNPKECRKVDRNLSFNFTTEIKDSSELGRQLVNTGKEEIIKTCKKQLASATGINQNLVDNINLDNVAETLKNIPFTTKHLQSLPKIFSSGNMLENVKKMTNTDEIDRFKDIVKGQIAIGKDELLKTCKDQFIKATGADTKIIEDVTKGTVVGFLKSKINDNSIPSDLQSLSKIVSNGKVLESVKEMTSANGLKEWVDKLKDNMTIANVYEFFKDQMSNLPLPEGLCECFESFTDNADPLVLMTWICRHSKIDMKILQTAKHAMECKNRKDTLSLLVKAASNHLEIPQDVMNLFSECLNNCRIGNSQMVKFVSCREEEELLRVFCTVLQFPELHVDIFCKVVRQKTNKQEVGIYLLKLSGMSDKEVNLLKDVKTIPCNLKQKYKLSNITISYLEDLLKSANVHYGKEHIAQILINVAKDLGSDIVDEESFKLICEVLDTGDAIERSMHIVKYFAKKNNVPVEYIEGLQAFVLEKNPTKLISSVATKLAIDQKMLTVLVNGVSKNYSIGKIVMQFMETTGIPDIAVGMLEHLVNKQPQLSCVWKSPI